MARKLLVLGCMMAVFVGGCMAITTAFDFLLNQSFLVGFLAFPLVLYLIIKWGKKVEDWLSNL